MTITVDIDPQNPPCVCIRGGPHAYVPVEQCPAHAFAEGQRGVRERVEAALADAWHNHSPRIAIADCRACMADDIRALMGHAKA